MGYSGPFCPEKVEPPSTQIDKVLRKFPYQTTNKEFKASDRKVTKSNPRAVLFLWVFSPVLNKPNDVSNHKILGGKFHLGK